MMSRTSLLMVHQEYPSSNEGYKSISPKTKAAENEKAFEEMQRWIAYEGGVVSNTKIANKFKKGMGVTSLVDHKEGDVLMFIPKSLHLTPNTETLPPALAELVEALPEELWHFRLALVILHERSKLGRGKFDRLMMTQPATFLRTPMFFNREQLDELQDTYLMSSVVANAGLIRDNSLFATRAMKKERDGGTPPLDQPFSGQNVGPNELGWAVAIAKSRAIRPDTTPDGQPRLVPLIDFINHSFSPNVRVEYDSDGNLLLVAERDIFLGDELTLNYGFLPNSAFLEDFGFLPQKNPHNTFCHAIDLRFLVISHLYFVADQSKLSDKYTGGEIDVNDWRRPEGIDGTGPVPLASWQIEILKKLPGVSQTEFLGLDTDDRQMMTVYFGEKASSIARKRPIVAHGDEPPQRLDWRLVAAARVLFANSKEELTESWDAVEGDIEAFGELRRGKDMNFDLEKRVLRELENFCKLFLMGGYGSTRLEDDIQMRQDKAQELSVNAQIGLDYRIANKELLRDLPGELGRFNLEIMREEARREGKDVESMNAAWDRLIEMVQASENQQKKMNEEGMSGLLSVPASQSGQDKS